MIYKHIKIFSLFLITFFYTVSTFPMLTKGLITKRSAAQYALKKRMEEDHYIPRKQDKEIFDTIIVVGKAVVDYSYAAYTGALVAANVINYAVTGKTLTTAMKDSLAYDKKAEEFKELREYKSNIANLTLSERNELEDFPTNWDGLPAYKVEPDKHSERGYKFVPDPRADSIVYENSSHQVIVGSDSKKIYFDINKKIHNELKAPGKPTENDRFFSPKKWDGKMRPHPEEGTYGFPDAKGNWWTPTGEGPKAHGGPHWDVIRPDGSHVNVMPGGKVRGTGEIFIPCVAVPDPNIEITTYYNDIASCAKGNGIFDQLKSGNFLGYNRNESTVRAKGLDIDGEIVIVSGPDIPSTVARENKRKFPKTYSPSTKQTPRSSSFDVNEFYSSSPSYSSSSSNHNSSSSLGSSNFVGCILKDNSSESTYSEFKGPDRGSRIY